MLTRARFTDLHSKPLRGVVQDGESAGLTLECSWWRPHNRESWIFWMLAFQIYLALWAFSINSFRVLRLEGVEVKHA